MQETRGRSSPRFVGGATAVALKYGPPAAPPSPGAGMDVIQEDEVMEAIPEATLMGEKADIELWKEYY